MDKGSYRLPQYVTIVLQTARKELFLPTIAEVKKKKLHSLPGEDFAEILRLLGDLLEEQYKDRVKIKMYDELMKNCVIGVTDIVLGMSELEKELKIKIKELRHGDN